MTQAPAHIDDRRDCQPRGSAAAQISHAQQRSCWPNEIRGHLQTTLGTDFDRVAQSILERGYDKAIVITDGCANLSEELAQQLRERKVRLLTVLFEGAQSCEALAALGESIALKNTALNGIE